jgi:hypothetical protein
MRSEVRAYPGIPRDIEDEAAEIATAKRQRKLAKRVKSMDPPSRAAAATTLAVQGASYPDIARILDYRTPVEAKSAVWEAIAQVGADHDDVEKMRTLMSHRLDRLLYSVMPSAVDNTNPEQVTFGRFALAILDRQAKLYGLDAAAQVVIYTPTQREIAAHAERITTLMRTAAGAIEADIIDAEVVGDDADAPGAA